ncbi:hypothetical protein [Hephaestia mangrovi]|uniref:hypothetical protein n=1 Tax=Hephaestia mangrovi TaxID=2873268 RepID=UPI001CA73238|nr:hypothetical protein [Hephaestia mangrovi]MBY8829852.1 hypothetical protein [Hephaestia mangrovi]
MSLGFAAALLASTLAATGQTAVKLPADEAAPGVRLTGDEVTVPLVLIKGYPFIEGEVNGVKGKFMFDIGSDAAITLNHHYVPLKNGIAMPGSKVGSGQTMPAQLNKTIASVRFGQFSYTNVHNVQSNDASQIEQHITPDYLGWVGFEFFRGYAVKIDYRKDTATFYKAGPAAVTHFLSGETVVAVIPFQRPKLARIPVVPVTIGKMRFDGAFDTGALKCGSTRRRARSSPPKACSPKRRMVVTIRSTFPGSTSPTVPPT